MRLINNSKKIFIFLLLILTLIFSSAIVSACTIPAVRSCNSECNHLPSYPTYEKEACITACIADDQNNWAAYYDCLDDESEQQQADADAAAQEAAEEAADELAAQEAAEERAREKAEEEEAERIRLEVEAENKRIAAEIAKLEAEAKARKDAEEAEKNRLAKVAEQKEVLQELRENGTSLNEWRRILKDNAEASKTLEECDAAMQAQIQSCSKNKDWMIDNAMDISSSASNEFYDYQNIAKKDGCFPDENSIRKIDTKSFDTQSGDYQVICSINCYTWECADPIHVPEPKGKLLRDGVAQAITINTKPRVGDVITTGPKESVTLIFAGGSKVKLGPNSVFTVTETSVNTFSYLLKSGKLWAKIEKLLKGETVIISTVKANFAVRGTEFVVAYDEETQVSTLHLYEGEVELSSGENTKTVLAGESVFTKPDNTFEVFALNVTAVQWQELLDEEVYKEGRTSIDYLYFAIGLLALFLAFVLPPILLVYYFVRKFKHKGKKPLEKSKLLTVSQWFYSIVLILVGIGSMFGGNPNVIGGVFLVVGIILFPPVVNLLNKFKKK